MVRFNCFLLSLLLLSCASCAFADDVLQWRGAHRDGVYKETGLLPQWPEKGPQRLWISEEAGNGYSSPIVVKGRVYVTGTNDENEFVTCFDLKGKKLWRCVYSPVWEGSYPEARTAPTYVAGRLYLVSASGVVACVDATSGKKIWSVEVWARFKAPYGRWGVSESPVVYDGKVICCPGGPKATLVALSARDGKLVWRSNSINDKAAYVSAQFIEYKGKKQVVAVMENYALGVNPDDGKIDWKFNYYSVFFDNGGNRNRHRINCNTPIFDDGLIFITSGYDHACVMLKLADDLSSVKVLWKNDILDVHHGHAVKVGDYLYGANWLSNSDGNWVCLEWKTGKKLYETHWGNKGAIIYADNHLYCYEERRGDFALVKVNPKKFEVISSFRVSSGSGKHWAHPVISNGILYHRHGEALCAYDIRQK